MEAQGAKTTVIIDPGIKSQPAGGYAVYDEGVASGLFVHLPDDGRRYQILDGELDVSASPITIHQTVSKRLGGLLVDHAEKAGFGVVFYAPFDVILDRREEILAGFFSRHGVKGLARDSWFPALRIVTCWKRGHRSRPGRQHGIALGHAGGARTAQC